MLCWMFPASLLGSRWFFLSLGWVNGHLNTTLGQGLLVRAPQSLVHRHRHMKTQTCKRSDQRHKWLMCQSSRRSTHYIIHGQKYVVQLVIIIMVVKETISGERKSTDITDHKSEPRFRWAVTTFTDNTESTVLHCYVSTVVASTTERLHGEGL